MRQYEKNLMDVNQQIQSYKDAELKLSSDAEAKEILLKIGFYRLRGYSFHLYNNETKKYKAGTQLSDIVDVYEFDMKLSHLLFGMLTSIEVSLRARFVEALLIYEDSLILSDPAIFADKQTFWRNNATVCSDIARSSDVFIKHNYNQHDGNIPIWAAVEVMSFGTLSKVIKNLKTGTDSAFSRLAEYYRFESANGKLVKPTKNMLTSWIHSATVLRNICAHNGRIYNRTINTLPELPQVDKVIPQPDNNGLYQVLLAMKYLSPTDNDWITFEEKLEDLIEENKDVVKIERLSFPKDWKNHLRISST